MAGHLEGKGNGMAGFFSVDAWQKVWVFRSTFLHGLGNTVKTSVFALLIALFLGIVVGLMATSGKKILTVLARVYVEFIQNTPVLLQMCFLYYALAFLDTALVLFPRVFWRWAFIQGPIWRK